MGSRTGHQGGEAGIAGGGLGQQQVTHGWPGMATSAWAPPRPARAAGWGGARGVAGDWAPRGRGGWGSGAGLPPGPPLCSPPPLRPSTRVRTPGPAERGPAEDAGRARLEARGAGRGRPGVPARSGGRRRGRTRRGPPGRAEVSGGRGGGGRARGRAGARGPVGAFVCGARGSTPRRHSLRTGSGRRVQGRGR